MIHSVEISGYRGLDRFRMSGLGRVNLLVGKNNSGKTSVLEALHILSSGGHPQALWQHCGRRGERLPESRDPRYSNYEIDISHLFTGHEIQLGSSFMISARNQSPHRMVSFTVEEPSEKERTEAGATLSEEGDIARPRLALRIKATPPAPIPSIPLSRRGGITIDTLDLPSRRGTRRSRGDSAISQYISTESLTPDELVRLWDNIALTPQEDLVLKALRFLDPKIERIAAIGGPTYYGPVYFRGGRGGFIIKHQNYTHPFPIGNLGDGTWRMLAMAIAITQCHGGMLLVDEIDTGLHHTVMADMWRLIYATADQFNVQVFATTHSYDCVHSLASICGADVETNSQVTLQRIEAERGKAVPYTEAEIRVAAERQIETR